MNRTVAYMLVIIALLYALVKLLTVDPQTPEPEGTYVYPVDFREPLKRTG